MVSSFTVAQTGRTHDRARPILQQRQKVFAKAPSTPSTPVFPFSGRSNAAMILRAVSASLGTVAIAAAIENEKEPRKFRREAVGRDILS
jgi:hypothetical protein